MRKTTIATLIVFGALAIIAAAVLFGPAVGDMGTVRQLSNSFMEDVQFKDFRSSSLYHHVLERDRVDVGKSIEKLFQLKPESIDIREFHIVKAEIDSSGTRARVHMRTKFQRLNFKDEPEESELVLYWAKRDPNCPMGATCVAGSCISEENQKLYKPPNPVDDDRPLDQRRLDANPELAKDAVAFTCDSTAEHRWFMNLGSTFKEKRYNY